MLFIKRLLSTTDLIPNQSAGCSIACISTTRPIYLVFEEGADYPVYVIRKINDAHSLHSRNIHNELYQLAGRLVPEPIGIFEHEGEKYDLQRGVKGVPWFQLKSKIRTVKSRTHLEKRIWQTLRDFQAAISTLDKNRTNSLQPQEELRKARSAYLHSGGTLSKKLESLVERAISELSSTSACPSIPQHGDFCLNNLIIDAEHITVIDFEDFLITKMPMYDHFTLALSLPSCGNEPAGSANVFSQASIVSAADALGIPEEEIRWHFLHHLLLRLGPWSTGVKRSRYRAWLKRVLDSFVDNQMTT